MLADKNLRLLNTALHARPKWAGLVQTLVQEQLNTFIYGQKVWITQKHTSIYFLFLQLLTFSCSNFWIVKCLDYPQPSWIKMAISGNAILSFKAWAYFNQRRSLDESFISDSKSWDRSSTYDNGSKLWVISYLMM